MNKKEFLEHPVLSEFDAITKVPRPSGQEEMISTYLVNWAKEKELYVEQDQWNNVFIRKPASQGYENKSTIALQAHMDMVCEKVPESNHNFDTDPIEYFIDGDIVSTHNQTTLGADDGIGMSIALAILADNNLKHPELEVIFTTDEEADFTGISNFDAKDIKSNFLINIDHACEDEIVCASAGGVGVTSSKKIDKKAISDNFDTYKINLSGLKGGHSGEDIHRGNGSSTILLFRLLNLININYQLLNIKSGTYRLAIPREAEAEIAFAKEDLESVKTIISNFKNTIIKEIPTIENSLTLNIEEFKTENLAFSEKDKNDLIKLILIYPNGIQEMSDVFDQLVQTSLNLGELYMTDDIINIVFEIRSLNQSEIDFTVYKVTTISNLFNYNIETYTPYCCWSFNDHSKLRELAINIFEEIQNQPIKPLALHAGLECGFFIEKKPEIDVISIGPNCKNFHSPSEEFSISSVEKIYQCLIKLLENIDF